MIASVLVIIIDQKDSLGEPINNAVAALWLAELTWPYSVVTVALLCSSNNQDLKEKWKDNKNYFKLWMWHMFL